MLATLKPAFLRRPKRRWSDKDRHFGPLTVAEHCDTHYPFRLALSSGHAHAPGCNLRFSGFGKTLILELPGLLRPTKAGQERIVGVAVGPTDLQCFYGPQTFDSRTSATTLWSYPWAEWRMVNTRLVEFDGQTTHVFQLQDVDGELITAEVTITAYLWRRGRGKWAWLSKLSRDDVTRSAELKFSTESGWEKSSWKGGALGASFMVGPTDTPRSVFEAYCAKNGQTPLPVVEA
jgi:hypothetical protein